MANKNNYKPAVLLFKGILKLDESNLVSNEKLILYTLCAMADPITGQITSSYAQLCKDTNLSLNTVKTRLNVLLDKKLIAMAASSKQYQKVYILQNILPSKKAKDQKEARLRLMFNDFWALYPKKVQKQVALTKWLDLDPDEALILTILKDVTERTMTEWVQNYDYIPYPATYLNQKR